jgi:hypothetical protein
VEEEGQAAREQALTARRKGAFLMNLLMCNTHHFFLYSIRRDEKGFYVDGHKLNMDGSYYVGLIVREDMPSEEAAYHRLLSLEKTKKKRKAARSVPVTELPERGLRWLAPPIGAIMSQADFLSMVEQAARERIVVFDDITGLNGAFFPGDEYVGYVTEDDDELIEVVGDDGHSYTCMLDRFEVVKRSKNALEVLHGRTA